MERFVNIIDSCGCVRTSGGFIYFSLFSLCFGSRLIAKALRNYCQLRTQRLQLAGNVF